MPDTLPLLLSLLGGYLFLHRCYWVYFPALRLDGYRILFLSGVWGVLFGLLGRLTTFSAHKHPWGRWFENGWLQLFSPVDFPYSGTAAAALAWSFSLSYLLNRIIDTEDAKHRAVKKFGDDLFRLFVDAAESFAKGEPVAVMLTLDDRKVYVGFILRCPLELHKAYVMILPIVSGYRHTEQLTVTFTVNYVSLWLSGKVPKETFFTYLPVSATKSAHVFDPDVYEKFFSFSPGARTA